VIGGLKGTACAKAYSKWRVGYMSRKRDVICFRAGQNWALLGWTPDH